MAFVTVHDPADRTAWSGINWSMAAGFRENGTELHHIGPLDQRHSLAQLARQAAYLGLLRRHSAERQPAVLDGYARQVEGALDGTAVDVVLSPSTIPIAYLRRPRLAFWTDATFDVLYAEYPGLSRLSGASVRAAHEQERAALEAAGLAVYASRWAAESAVERYGADPAKVHVVPFGANLVDPKSRAEVEELVESRPSEPCRLLWVGTDWERKQGAFALEVAREVNSRGLRAEMTLVGDTPPDGVRLPGHARHVGWVDKWSDAGRREFDGYFSAAHFFVLPTAAECAGCVFSEAGAYGVPVLGPAVGGLPDTIVDGENGLLMDREASPADWADALVAVWGDQGRYKGLALSSHRRFEEVLNWRVAARRVLELIDGLP